MAMAVAAHCTYASIAKICLYVMGEAAAQALQEQAAEFVRQHVVPTNATARLGRCRAGPTHLTCDVNGMKSASLSAATTAAMQRMLGAGATFDIEMHTSGIQGRLTIPLPAERAAPRPVGRGYRHSFQWPALLFMLAVVPLVLLVYRYRMNQGFFLA